MNGIDSKIEKIPPFEAVNLSIYYATTIADVVVIAACHFKWIFPAVEIPLKTSPEFQFETFERLHWLLWLWAFPLVISPFFFWDNFKCYRLSVIIFPSKIEFHRKLSRTELYHESTGKKKPPMTHHQPLSYLSIGSLNIVGDLQACVDTRYGFDFMEMQKIIC